MSYNIKWFIDEEASAFLDIPYELRVGLSIAPTYCYVRSDEATKDSLIKKAKTQILRSIINQLLETEDWFEENQD